MNIALEGESLIIQANREYTTDLRSLPDRKWNPERAVWIAPYTVENYEFMQQRGWPIQHIARPTRSSLRVELVSYKSETYFAVHTPQGHEWVDRCRRIPEYRMWSTAASCWLCKPTHQNAEYIEDAFAGAVYSDAARQRMDKIMAAVKKAQEAAAETKKKSAEPQIEILDFKFKTVPYDHQTKAFALSRDREAFALFMEQGTGKTKVVIDTAAWLRSKNAINALVVICPNDVKDVWPEELDVHMPDWVKYEVIVEGRQKRLDLNRFVAPVTHRDALKVFVTNVESLVSRDRFERVQKFIATHRALVVADESTRFKNPSAKRTKALIKLSKIAPYRRIMTGTPMTQSPLDLFAPCKFLDPNILGFGTYVSMVKHHGILGGFQGKQVVGFQKVEEIKQKLEGHSFRVLREECLDLPEKIFIKHYVELSGEQRRVYNDLRDELVAELSTGQRITAAHQLVKMLRLAQVVGGFIRPDAVDLTDIDGDMFDDTAWNERASELVSNKVQEIPGSNPKLDTTLSIIEELSDSSKVIIWARFRAEIELIERRLAEIYGKDSVVTFYGGVARDERTERRHRFQGTPTRSHDPSCRFFVAQVDTGSVGLTLTRAQTVIYYSNSFSLETRLQSEDRTHRIGQTGAVTYHDLVARDTLDTALIGALRRKKKFADQITGDRWKEWL